MTTLVIGARGRVGRHVLDLLAHAGEPVRAAARNPATAGLPPDVPVVAADLTRPETLRRALDGVARVFLYAPTAGASGFVDAALGAGLERVVVLSSGSVLLPYAAGNAIAEEHRAVERALAASGLPWTPVRPLVLAANALNWAESIRTEGVVRLVYPEAVTAPVHERDIAAVAAAVLLGEAGDEAGTMLTGPEALTQRRQAELIGAATGRDIRVEELTESAARARFGGREDADTFEAILQFLRAATTGGSPATDTAARVLGRPARPFARWAQEHASEFR